MYKESEIHFDVKCRWCKRNVHIKVLESEYNKYTQSGRVKDLRSLKSDEKEMFISQTCNDCWNKMFSDFDD